MNAFKLRCFHALVILQVRPLEWTPTYLELDKLPDGRYRATVGTLFEYQGL
jgi:hypothetical protein